MRALLLSAFFSFATAALADEARAPKPVEEEVVDLDALDAQESPGAPKAPTATRVPEHEYDLRLLAFPALLVGILMWNVKWRVPPKPKAKAS